MKQIGQSRQFLPRSGRIIAYFDHSQFITDKGLLIEVDNLDDVNEFCQLAHGLLQFLIVFDADDDIEPGHIPFFRVPCRQ